LPPSLEQELPSAVIVVIVVIVSAVITLVVMTASGIAPALPSVTKASVLVVSIIEMPFVEFSELSAEKVGDKFKPTVTVRSASVVS